MNQPADVVVRDVQMPFWSMVWFLIKLAFASIPAMIVVWTVMLAIAVLWFAIIRAMFGGIGYFAERAKPSASPTPTPAVIENRR